MPSKWFSIYHTDHRIKFIYFCWALVTPSPTSRELTHKTHTHVHNIEIEGCIGVTAWEEKDSDRFSSFFINQNVPLFMFIISFWISFRGKILFSSHFWNHLHRDWWMSKVLLGFKMIKVFFVEKTSSDGHHSSFHCNTITHQQQQHQQSITVQMSFINLKCY